MNNQITNNSLDDQLTDLERELMIGVHTETSFNAYKFAKEKFSIELLESFNEQLLQDMEDAKSSLDYKYQMTPIKKAIIHHVSFELAKHLWKFATPQLKAYQTEEGHFNIEYAKEQDNFRMPYTRSGISHDAASLISKILPRIYSDWQSQIDEDSEIGLLNKLYIHSNAARYYKGRISDGVMKNTFAEIQE